jgi:hypothetical protein
MWYIHHLLTVRTVTMAHIVVGGKTDSEHVGVIVLTELFVSDSFFGKKF